MNFNDYGLMATFKSAKDIYHACEKVRDAGYTKWESYTPFPLHGLDKAMGMTRSNVPRFTLIGGLTGFTLATLMVWVSVFYEVRWMRFGNFASLMAIFISCKMANLILKGQNCLLRTKP